MKKLTKIRKSAKGMDCDVRIPGYCNHNPETTVLAHKNGAGMATKSPDYLAAYCCSSCHDVVDGRVRTDFSYSEVKEMFYEGIFRTQARLVDFGLLVIK